MMLHYGALSYLQKERKNLCNYFYACRVVNYRKMPVIDISVIAIPVDWPLSVAWVEKQLCCDFIAIVPLI